MAKMIIDFVLGPTMILIWALYFTITYFEYLIRDATAKDDTWADHMMVEKVAGCVLWGIFYFMTH